MEGNINFIGSLSGDISGGGGGGSDVTITPTLTSGTKIADYEINSEGGSLYAPTPTSLTAELPLVISNNVISIDLSGYATVSDLDDYQEKLTAGNYINIDSNNEISCTPPITNVWYTPEPDVQQDVLIGKFTVNEVTQNVYAPSGGKWDYSTSEVNTGQKWIDGKDIYCRVYRVLNPATNGNNTLLDITINCNNIYLLPTSNYNFTMGGNYNGAQYLDKLSPTTCFRIQLGTGGLYYNSEGSFNDTCDYLDIVLFYTKKSA